MQEKYVYFKTQYPAGYICSTIKYFLVDTSCIHFTTGILDCALKIKEDEVYFIRGHVSQLTQSISQLSLPPSQEKAKNGMVAILERVIED